MITKTVWPVWKVVAFKRICLSNNSCIFFFQAVYVISCKLLPDIICPSCEDQSDKKVLNWTFFTYNILFKPNTWISCARTGTSEVVLKLPCSTRPRSEKLIYLKNNDPVTGQTIFLKNWTNFSITILLLWKWNGKHVTSTGQRKNLSTRQDSNLWPPKHRAGALSTWAGSLAQSNDIMWLIQP